MTHLIDTVAVHQIVKSGERSTPCGCPLLSHRSRGVAPKTRGQGNTSNPATPPGCRTYQSGNKCDALAGSYIFTEVFIPGVFGTTCLDTRSKKR